MPGIKQHLFKTFLRTKCAQELLFDAAKIFLTVVHADIPRGAICTIHTNRTIVSINWFLRPEAQLPEFCLPGSFASFRSLLYCQVYTETFPVTLPKAHCTHFHQGTFFWNFLVYISVYLSIYLFSIYLPTYLFTTPPIRMQTPKSARTSPVLSS